MLPKFILPISYLRRIVVLTYFRVSGGPRRPEYDRRLLADVAGGVRLRAVGGVDVAEQVEHVLAPLPAAEAERLDGGPGVEEADRPLHQRGSLGDAQHQLGLGVLEL